MSEIMEDIAYLSQEIGPRPAGTEEEQQAAIYISDMMKKRTGLETAIEDFACNPKPDLAKVVMCVLAIAVSIAAMINGIVVIPAIVVGVLCAIFFTLESTGKPFLSKALSRGVSQNVVSKYVPAAGTSRRARKVVVVASYDSGKVRKELGVPNALPVIDKMTVAAMIATPVIWALRAGFAMKASGTALIAWNAATIVVLLIAALPVVFFAVYQMAQYNEAANCNAASVASMMEVAKRIANTPAVQVPASAEATIHGEAAARAEGLVPEGAQIVYGSAPAAPVSVQPEEDGSQLAAESCEEPAAAPTAAPAPSEPESSFVYLDEDLGWPGEYSFGNPEAAGAAPEEAAEAAPSVPEWYTKAQAKANRPAESGAPVRRSRFASALDQAVETSHQRAQQAAAAEAASRAAALASAHEAARLASRPAAPAPYPQGSGFPVGYEPEQRESQIPADQEEPMLEAVAEEVLPEEQPQATESAAEEDRAPEMNTLAAVAQMAMADARARGEEIEPLPVYVPPVRVQPEEVAQEPQEEQVFAEEPVMEDAPLPEAAVDAPADPGEEAAADQADQPEEPVAQDEQEEVPTTGTVAIPRIDVSALRRRFGKRKGGDEVAAEEPAAQPEEAVAEPEPAPEAQEQPAEEPAARNPLLEEPGLLADLPQIEPGAHQRAPLAESNANPSLSSRIPRVNLDAFGISTAGNAEPMDNKRAALRNMLPSLSGSISFETADQEPERGTVSRTGSFAPVSMSGSIGPVGDELIEGVDPEEIYVDDVDDSDYGTNMTETGAFAGPGYVEMPESRASRFFGKFRRKKKEQEVPAHEWLDVDSDFNPTEAGAEMGSWEGFKDKDRNRSAKRKHDDGDQAAWDDGWNGGAFSKVRSVASKVGEKVGLESADREEPEPVEADLPETGSPDQEPLPVEELQEAAPLPVEEPQSTLASIASQFSEGEEAVEEEIKQIEDFHLKNVDVEVWFVALGSECAANGGSRAFFEQHAEELRGALIVNLEGLGAGAFCQIGTEGTYGAKTASPRLKRLVKKAQQVTGVTFTDAAIRWKDSIASLALKRGLHAVTLAGMENKKPAYMGQGDDVIENVDAELLHRRIEFVEALIRHA